MNLLPLLTVVESGFDVIPDLVMVGLGLDNRQPLRPVGLGLQQYYTAIHRYRHNETVLN